jgi:SAM-dependent methyltransferase
MSFAQQFMEKYDADQAGRKDLESMIYYQASRSKFDEIVSLMALEPFSSVIEIGTSELPFLLKCVAPSFHVATLDPSPSHQERCNIAGIEFIQGDVLLAPLPIPDNHYDLILFSEVLEHLRGNPRIAFNEFFRILKPGGRLIVTTPNLVRLNSRFNFLRGRSPLEKIGGNDWQGHFREYVLSELRDFAGSTGFTMVKACHALYWDSLQHYLASGNRGFDENGEFYYTPRFRGISRIAATPFLLLAMLLVTLFPSLRTALLLVCRKPSAP